MSQWSDSLKKLTHETLTNLPVVSFMRNNSCFLKNLDGRYGTISLMDALAYRYRINILDSDDDEVVVFEDIGELVDAGWVVD